MAKKDKKIAPKGKKASEGSEVYQKFKQNPALYLGSVVILVLIVFIFIFLEPLTQTVGDNRGDNIFGYYDKVPVKYEPDNAFAQFHENAVRHYQSQGYDLSNRWIAAQITREAFEGAVVHTAILQLMKRSNYFVPKKTVDHRAAQSQDYMEGGRFSPTLYKQIPASRHAQIWRDTQEEVIKGVFFNDFFDGLLLTNAEAEFIGAMASPQRTFEMVSFNVDDFPQSEYASFAMENPKLFDSIHLSVITVTSGEKDAKKLLDSIQKGTLSFEEAARSQSQDDFAERDGDMGSRYVFDLHAEIPNPDDREIVFNLRKGDISSVINVDESWKIFRVEEPLKRADFNDDQVMERVSYYLRNNERGRMEDWAIAEAQKFIEEAKSTSFAQAAKNRLLEIRSFGPFPVNYGGVELFSGLQSNPIPGFDEQQISELSRNENFWKTAFSTRLDIPSEPFVHGSRVMVLLPTSETDEQNAAMDAASTYLSYWMNLITEQSIQYYFLSNPRMDDRFWQVYSP